MPAAPARPLVTLRGRLAVQTVRRGTGSEQQALVLEVDGSDPLVLVKLGGPSFGLPPEASLAGRQVEVEGYRLDAELRYTRLQPV